MLRHLAINNNEQRKQDVSGTFPKFMSSLLGMESKEVPVFQTSSCAFYLRYPGVSIVHQMWDALHVKYMYPWEKRIVFKIEEHYIFFMALNILQCTSIHVNTMLICISLSLQIVIFLQADFSKTNSKFHMNRSKYLSRLPLTTTCGLRVICTAVCNKTNYSS